MELSKKFQDLFGGRFSGITKDLSRKVFGANNETLDFLMDSFYKLSPEHRAASIIGAIVGLFFLSIGVLWVYFASVASLDQSLNQSFNALHQLRSLKQQYQYESSRFDRLMQNVQRKTSAIRIRPFFEDKSQAMGIELRSLRDTIVALPPDNPLSDRLKYSKLSLTIQKISIPRLMAFITEIEKSNNFITLEDLELKVRFDNKLFFDADLEFRSYSLVNDGGEL